MCQVKVHTGAYKNVLRTLLSFKIYCAVFSLSKDFIIVIKLAIKYSSLRSHRQKILAMNVISAFP